MSLRPHALRWIPILCALGLPACSSLDGPRPEPAAATSTLDGETRDPWAIGDTRIDLGRLDQPEPSLAQEESRRKRQRRPPADSPRLPRFYALFSIGVGQYRIDDDVLGSDQEPAGMFRFRIGGGSRSGRGAGLDAKIVVPEDELYAGSVNALDAYQYDVYAHYTTHITHGRFRMPIRVGPYFNHVSNEFVSTSEGTDYRGFGFRLELEPEIILVQSEQFDMSVFHDLSIGTHLARVSDDGTSENYFSSGNTLGLELGLRFRLADLNLSTAVRYDRTYFRETDAENGFVIPSLETELLALQITMGLRF